MPPETGLAFWRFSATMPLSINPGERGADVKIRPSREANMAAKVLIAYGSKYGSTAEIAVKIAEVLKQEGIDAVLLPIDKVKDLAGYQNIIIGSAMYVGMWWNKVADFLKKNEKLLTGRKVWLFATGPSGKGDPVQLLKGVVAAPNVKQITDRIKPQDMTVFHGYLNPQKMNGIERWMIKRVGGETGDFRDWEMITAWAKKIAAALKG
jgi:menaquinone-dependent protoporphyrinogen oxidase